MILLDVSLVLLRKKSLSNARIVSRASGVRHSFSSHGLFTHEFKYHEECFNNDDEDFT